MSKTKNEETSVALYTSQIPALAGRGSVDMVRENLGGMQITFRDLPKIKNPSGGATQFIVPTMEGEEYAKSISGIVLYMTGQHVYWKPDSQMGGPPDCVSTDRITGVGDPGGLCLKCPFHQWGSDVRNDGKPTKAKACKEVVLIFILEPGCVLPRMMIAPPSSKKAILQYGVKLDRYIWQCVTEFALVAAKSANGDAYATITARKVGDLTADEAAIVAAYRKDFMDVFTSATIDEPIVPEP